MWLSVASSFCCGSSWLFSTPTSDKTVSDSQSRVNCWLVCLLTDVQDVGFSLCGVFKCKINLTQSEATHRSAFVSSRALKSTWCVRAFVSL